MTETSKTPTQSATQTKTQQQQSVNKKQAQTKGKKSSKMKEMKESAIYISKSMYERFQQDLVLRGPIVAVVKWSVVVLLCLYGLAIIVDYLFNDDTYFQTIIVSMLSFIWWYLQIFLYSYIVYHDSEKAFLNPNPTLFEKYRCLLFWFAFVNLSTMLYKYFVTSN